MFARKNYSLYGQKVRDIIKDEIETITKDMIILEEIVEEENKNLSQTYEEVKKKIKEIKKKRNYAQDNLRPLYQEIQKKAFTKMKYPNTIKKIIERPLYGGKYNFYGRHPMKVFSFIQMMRDSIINETLSKTFLLHMNIFYLTQEIKNGEKDKILLDNFSLQESIKAENNAYLWQLFFGFSINGEFSNHIDTYIEIMNSIHKKEFDLNTLINGILEIVSRDIAI